MEDFSKPTNVNRQSSYVPRVVFNPAADILKAIETVEGTFVERKNKVNLFQQQAEQRYLDQQKSVSDTKNMDRPDLTAKMTEEFSSMVDEVYKADIASFDGDRTDYLRKSDNATRVLGSYQKIIGQISAEQQEYQNMNPEEQAKMVLRSPFSGENGDKRKKYLNFINDPSKMGIRIQDGELIITNKGEDLFNGNEYLNSRADGFSLVNYGNDYTKQLEAAGAEAAEGLQNLVEASSIEKQISNGTQVQTQVLNNYLPAVEAYKKNLEESDKIKALINESTFQRFTSKKSIFDPKKDSEITKEKMIEFLINKKFPQYNKVLNTAIGNIKTSIEKVKAKGQLTDYQKYQIQRQEKIDKALANKTKVVEFSNKDNKPYEDKEVNKFFKLENKAKGIRIAMQQIIGEGLNEEGLVDEAGEIFVKLKSVYPSLKDEKFTDIDTPAKLREALLQTQLGDDYDTYMVMNKQYKKYEKAVESGNLTAQELIEKYK